MGACNSATCNSKKSKRKNYNSKVYYEDMHTEIKSIDDTTADLPDVLKQIEQLRKKFSLKWNEFLDLSGAVVIQSPSIKSGILGYIYQLALGSSDNMLKAIKLQSTPPLITFDESVSYLLTKDCSSLIKQFEDFMQFFADIRDETEYLYSTFKTKYDLAKTQIADYKFENLQPDEKIKISNKITLIDDSLNTTFELISFIRNIVNKRDSDVDDLRKEMTNPQFIEELILISNEFNGKKQNINPVNLNWRFAKEKKVQSLSVVKVRQYEARINKEELAKI